MAREEREDAGPGEGGSAGWSHSLMHPEVWCSGDWGAEMSGGAWRPGDRCKALELDGPSLRPSSSAHWLGDSGQGLDVRCASASSSVKWG